MIGLLLAATFAVAAPQPSPSPSPSPRAAYYDEIMLPAAAGDHHAEMQSAIAALLGEQMIVTTSDVPGPPGYTRETACKSLGVRHLVVVGGGEFRAISNHGHPGGSKSLELTAWIWDCREQRLASNASATSAWYDNAGGHAMRAMYRDLSATVIERVRKALTEPPDLALP